MLEAIKRKAQELNVIPCQHCGSRDFVDAETTDTLDGYLVMEYNVRCGQCNELAPYSWAHGCYVGAPLLYTDALRIWFSNIKHAIRYLPFEVKMFFTPCSNCGQWGHKTAHSFGKQNYIVCSKQECFDAVVCKNIF